MMSIRRYIRRHLTTANAISITAIVVSLGGTSYAAITVTGNNVTNGSLTNLDFKLGTLGLNDLAEQTRNSLRGPKGEKGGTGFGGESGDSGAKGILGPAGQPAALTSTWATHVTGLIKDSTADFNAPNVPESDWDDAGYGAGLGGPNLRTTGNYHELSLTQAWKPIIALDGMTSSDPNQSMTTYGRVTLPWAGAINAVASLTFMHRSQGEDLSTHTGGTLRNVRLRCQVAYGLTNDTSTFTTMGAPVYASSAYGHELVNVTLTGNVGKKNLPNQLLAAGTYNVAVLCRDVDSTGNTASDVQWSFVSGNLTVVGSRP